MKKILIVEDHAIVRLGIDYFINDLFDKVLVMQAGSFLEALSLVQHNSVDLIILDVSIPDGESTRMIARFRTYQPDVKILAFSGLGEKFYALHYMQAGANGYLSKGASESEYKLAITSVLDTGKYVSEKVQEQICDNENIKTNPLDDLSKRELEVMLLLAQGKWTKEIASDLNLKETTVSTYKSRIFEKLKVENIIEMFKKIDYYKTEDLI